LAKIKGNYFNKVILLQEKQTMSAKLLKTKTYSSTGTQLLFKGQKKWHLLSATFSKNRFTTYKKHTAVPTASIYIYKSTSAIMPLHLHKAKQIEGGEQSEFYNSLCIFL